MSEPIYHRTSDVPGLTEAIAQYGHAGEGVVVKEIVAMLEARGYRKPDKAISNVGYYVLAGQRNTTHSGSTSGVPDLLVLTTLKCWPIEIKAREKDARISPAQWAMHKAGALHICNAVAQVEKLLDAG